MTAKIKTLPKASSSRHRHKPKGLSKRAFERVYWPYLPLVIMVAGLVVLNAQAGAFQSALKGRGQVLSYASSMTVNNLLADTNNLRLQNQATSLKLNEKLDAAAQAKANDMASRNYWSHETPEGAQPWTFVKNQNYAYQKLGENLAAGFSNEQATVNGWMASLTHRQNLLDPAYSEVGFGIAQKANYTAAGNGPMTIVVAFYGQPEGAPVLSPRVAPAAQVKSTNTQNPGETLKATPERTSSAQVALAGSSLGAQATNLSLLITISALAIWLSRHLVAVRKVWTKSEAFIVHHPLLDVGLITVAGLSFLLSWTVGFIL